MIDDREARCARKHLVSAKMSPVFFGVWWRRDFAVWRNFGEITEREGDKIENFIRCLSN